MNISILRYVGLALVAMLFGVGGGFLAVKDKADRPTPPSGTTVAVPAQPFPGQGIRAIPAIPAEPDKGRPDIKPPSISYIQGNGVLGKTVAPKNMVVKNGGGIVYGTNFHPRNNNIYWDGILLAKDEAPQDTSGFSTDLQQLYLPALTDITLGSFHDVYVKTPYGTSNTIRVQVVENAWAQFQFWGVRPEKAPIGTKVEVALSELLGVDKPLSSEMYAIFLIPASAIKSGEAGGAFVFVPLEKNPSDAGYSFTVKEGIYCPSAVWPSEWCKLAPPDTKVAIPVGGPYTPDIFIHLEFKYLGTVIERSIYGVNIFTGWYKTFTVTP